MEDAYVELVVALQTPLSIKTRATLSSRFSPQVRRDACKHLRVIRQISQQFVLVIWCDWRELWPLEVSGELEWQHRKQIWTRSLWVETHTALCSGKMALCTTTMKKSTDYLQTAYRRKETLWWVFELIWDLLVNKSICVCLVNGLRCHVGFASFNNKGFLTVSLQTH